EELPVDFVHGQERCGHTARAGQELPPADAELAAGCLGEFLHARLDPLLLVGLRHRHVLAVGDHPRRDGRAEGLRHVCPLAPGHLLGVEQPVVLFPDATRLVPLGNGHVVILRPGEGESRRIVPPGWPTVNNPPGAVRPAATGSAGYTSHVTWLPAGAPMPDTETALPK